MPESVTKMINIVGSGTPLYVQVAESLRNRIVSGDLPPGYKLPSEAELAASLGINHLTLRKSLRILSEQKLISQRQGCGTFVAYSPAGTFRLGLCYDNSSDGNSDFYTLRIISALNQQLNRTGGGEIILLDCHEQDAEGLLDKLNQNRCDGLVVSAVSHITASLCEKAFDFIPMVFINNRDKRVAEAGRYEARLGPGSITKAIDHLVGLGHRRIAYASADVSGDPTLLQRNAEFLEYGLKEGIPLIAPNGEYWYDSSRKNVFELCRSQKAPTAIICPGIIFSYGAWLGAVEAGVRIPDDLSFVGFDAYMAINPYMTSLEQPINQMAAKAIELLRGMKVAGKHLKQRIYEFDAQLSERGSCKKIN